MGVSLAPTGYGRNPRVSNDSSCQTVTVIYRAVFQVPYHGRQLLWKRSFSQLTDSDVFRISWRRCTFLPSPLLRAAVIVDTQYLATA